MSARTKILFFLFGSVGGAERMTISIGKILPKERYVVKFVVCWRKDDICKFIPKEYEIIRIPWHNIYCFPVTRMSWLIHREKPDFVFGSTNELNLRLIKAARINNVKAIVRCNTTLTRLSSRFLSSLAKQYKRAYKVIAQQEEMRQELISILSLPSERVITLQNVLDLDSISEGIKNIESPYTSVGELNFVSVGRFAKVKGQDVLLEAFSIVKKQLHNAKLYCVGEFNGNDSFTQSCRDIIVKNRLENDVILVGFDANPYPWIKFADCFVLPSRKEGLPNALIEAQYLGTPSAATKCAPIVERIIKENENGCLASVENSEELADAMMKAVQLGRIRMTYQPADVDDFAELFS